MRSWRFPAQRLEALGLGEEQLRDPVNPAPSINRRVQLIMMGKLQ
jgi:hypothetical protein